ncbi:MAG TPA: TonB-dependent receptor [Ferruginibacter sp.]|nr:TonB-dependent receptor [Ferruginibacter sp.]
MKVFFILLQVVIALPLFSQVTVLGRLTDTKNKPLIGASVTIKNSYDGGTTDSAGNYKIVTTETGNQVIEVTLSGYSSYEKNIAIEKKDIILNIMIKELITELKAVVITAGSFEASDKKKATVLTSIDIVTTASANADITAAIKTLPGAQQVGETEGLFVRGGTANESKTFIDGTLVNNFYYSSEPGLAQRGRFNPFLFKGTIFSAGGYSALYGQALSSALILESIDFPEKSSADIAISYLAAGGGLQHLAKDKKSSWGISYNYTDLRLAYKLIKQNPDYFKLPVLHGGDANFRVKTKGGILKYYGTFSSTRVGFRYADIDTLGLKNAFSLDNLNMYHNISWKERMGNGYSLVSGISYSTNKDDINNELQDSKNEKQVITAIPSFANKNFNVVTHGNYANAKVVIEKKLKALSAIRFGSEFNYSNEKTDFTAYNGDIAHEKVDEQLLSVFGETDIYITNNIAAKIGVRTEHSKMLDKWNIAPRLSLAYKLAENSQVSFAYGMFYQDPDKRLLPAYNSLDFAKATHYILQYQKINNNRTFRTEVFYKKYDDLVKTAVLYGRQRATSNEGSGNAQGVEFFWRDKKTIKNVDYWVSYSYVDTKRDFLNYPTSIAPSFAAKHTGSLVVKKFVTKLKSMLNASYTYATGRPYYDIRFDNTAGKYKIFDQGRTKDFNSMSFSVNYLPFISSKGANKFTVFVFSVTNVLGAKNIYSYNYSYDGRNKVAVTPPAKRFIYLGCFLSFGIDRTEQAINNNL